ncbi:putative laccase [Helianthus anomalus]
MFLNTIFICSGTWIMHCYLNIHISSGLASVFIVEDGPWPIQNWSNNHWIYLC